MANTGYEWDADMTSLTQSPVTLTQGDTTSNTGETGEIDLSGKAACLLSFDIDYTGALSGTGLVATIRRDVNDTVWESSESASISFEFNHTEGTIRKVIALDASQFQKFVVQLDWSNETASSVAVVAMAVKYSTVPLAS